MVNRCVQMYLCCFIGSKPKIWVTWLPWAEYSYNTSFHLMTQMRHFMAVYEKSPPPIVPYLVSETKLVEVEDQLLLRDQILKKLQQNLRLAQEKMKCQADKHCTNRNFKVGDAVYLKLQPYRQRLLMPCSSEKLSPRFFGPYPILC